MNKTYIFGHKNPDTDSVCSAIALSYLKNQLGMHTEPRILGHLNNETKFVLNYFKVDTPRYLNDVKLQIRDIDYGKGYMCYAKQSLYDAINYLRDNHLSTIPVVDDDKTFLGLLSMKDITTELISWDYDGIKTSYQNILNTIKGTEVLKFEDEIVGNVLVASYRSTTFINDVELTPNDILILGDRHSIIEYAVESGVKLIIITGDNDIKDVHLKIAEKNKVNIIKTSLRTFNVVKIIGMCNYAETLMYSKNIISVHENDYVKDFIELTNKLKYKVYPVLNNKKECLGVVQLSDTAYKNKKQVILVDHNEKEQSADGLDEADIVEIVDHHKIGTIGTKEPINFRNMTVGCTSSIIYMLFKENRVTIPKKIAGIMLSAILSDTLLFRSPTTTEFDKEIAYNLSNLVELDIEDFAEEMFTNGSSLKGKSIEDILYTDFKTFNLDNIKIGVGQINIVNIEELDNLKNELCETFNNSIKEQGYTIIMLFATDIIREGSYVYYNEEAKKIIEKAFEVENLYQGCFINGIISRKKQMIPSLVNVFEEK